MNALRILKRRLRRLGWPGTLGAGLMACGAGFYIAVLLPAQARLDAMRADMLVRREALRHYDAALGEGNTPEGQLARYYRAFPAAASLPEWLDRMFAEAARQGIALDQGDYKLTHNAAGKLVRFQIALPVRSDYPRIRKFIAGLKAEIPVVALEHVQFERQKIADPQVEATIKLALYLEASP